MSKEKDLLRKFYEAFGRGDWQTMNNSYSEEAVFLDPVFGNLDAHHVKAMWHMLCSNAKNFSLKILKIEAQGGDNDPGTDQNEYFTVEWEADYDFSATGRRVKNRVKSFIKIEDDKIAGQTDDFNFYRWSRQAFGWKGLIFGPTIFFKNSVRRRAREKLIHFIAKNYPDQSNASYEQ